jgi:hypothetical protein
MVTDDRLPSDFLPELDAEDGTRDIDVPPAIATPCNRKER